MDVGYRVKFPSVEGRNGVGKLWKEWKIGEKQI